MTRKDFVYAKRVSDSKARNLSLREIKSDCESIPRQKQSEELHKLPDYERDDSSNDDDFDEWRIRLSDQVS